MWSTSTMSERVEQRAKIQKLETSLQVAAKELTRERLDIAKLTGDKHKLFTERDEAREVAEQWRGKALKYKNELVLREKRDNLQARMSGPNAN